MEWLVFFLIFIGILIVKMMFDGSLKGIGHLFNDMAKNNVRSELKDKSKGEYYAMMCARLNEGGFRNNGKYWRSDDPYFFSSVMDNYDAVKYLKEYHLLNNGKCPICGKSFDYEEIGVEYHNTYYRQEIKGWEMTFPNGATCHVCEECATKQNIEKKSETRNKTNKIILESILKTDPAILNFKETRSRYDNLLQRDIVRRAHIEINRNELPNILSSCIQRGFKFSEPKDGVTIFPNEANSVTLQDIFPEFSGIKSAIVYEYIGASIYQDLSEQDRMAYQPVVITKNNFYQTNPDTGEVLRDENGRAIIQSQGAGVFTNSLGEVVFRTSVIRPEEELANENKLKLVPFNQEVVDMLEEYPAALEAIDSRLSVAQASTIDDSSDILTSSIEKSHMANLVMLSKLEGIGYPGAEMVIKRLSKIHGVALQEVGTGWKHTICPSSGKEKHNHIIELFLVMTADRFISKNQYDFVKKIATDYGYSKEAFDSELIKYIESAERAGIYIVDLREDTF